MPDKIGYLVRHLPCGHKRVIDAPSVKLALALDGYLQCLECDAVGEWDLPEGLIELPWVMWTPPQNIG